jgi:septal ring-binding cell division protein DamX
MSEQPADPGANSGGERMLRDMERWHERFELSLDNRQVFFLFFGGALAACLIFVLGVMVGKRLEARARDQMVPMRSDPLAALDQAAEEAEADEAAERAARARSGRPAEHATASPVAPASSPPPAAPAPSPSEAPPGGAGRAAQPTPRPAASPGRQSGRPEAPLPQVPAPSAASGAHAPPAAVPAHTTSAPSNPAASAPAGADPSPTAGEKPSAKGSLGPAAHVPPVKYTLQLSAFQDRGEADDFARKLSGTGYKPSIVAADIPGRGVWYRVRVGEYPSQKAAVDAKGELERKLHLTAYVTRL